MDTTLLGNPAFWTDPAPLAAGGSAGDLDAIPELAGHVLFQTSGSTGNPKWVAISKQALLVSAATVNAHLRVTSASVWGLALPLHHVGGFGVAARAFEAACELRIFPRRWDAALFSQWLAVHSVSHTSLVPTQVHDLVKAGLKAPPNLLAVVVGGGMLDTSTGRAARDLGWPVLASFGMTETSSQIATQGLDSLQIPYQPAPIPLLPVWKCRLAENDILELSGPSLFSGYLIGETYVPRTDEWHTTSDRVSLQGNHLSPLGRSDRWVKVLGELVDPGAIERELAVLSGGRISASELAVIAVPNERAGHLLVPFFESKAEPADIQKTLLAYQQIAPGFRRLQPAEVVEKLPRSPLGKLLRPKLADVYQRSFRGGAGPFPGAQIPDFEG